MTGKNSLSPFSTNLYILVLLAGPIVIIPYLRRQVSVLHWVLIIAGSFVPVVCIVFLPVNWFFLFLVMALYQVACFFLFIKYYPLQRKTVKVSIWQERFRNTLTVFMLALPLSLLYACLERWITDLLFSTFYEVNFSLKNIFSDYIQAWFKFLVLVLITAFYSGRYYLRWSIEKSSVLIGLTALAYLPVRELYFILVSIPQRHGLVAGIFPEWVMQTREYVFIFLYLAGISLLVHQTLGYYFAGNKIKRFFFRGVISFCLAVFGIAIISGMPANYSFLIGRQFEKYGWTQSAVRWYSRTLSWVQTSSLKSYLQFHVGLLHRKNGNQVGLREALNKVLLKYNKNPEIVQKAKRIQRNLAKQIGNEGERRVIPGVEARTEYKAAYCVPNSLGLVLNYWGDKVGAKTIGASITKLGEGSYITDQAYYAESRGFKHLVLPLRKRQDIKQLIGRGIPVLAFIPGHVLAIFGYDDMLETYISYDVNTSEIWDETNWNEFEPDWNRSYNILAVVVPEEKLSDLATPFGEGSEKTNEHYLQYLIASLSDKSITAKVRNLSRAVEADLFFADWEYTYYTGRKLGRQAPDSMVYNYLFRNGVSKSSILLYLQNLYSQNQFGDAIEFLELYRQKNSLSMDLTIVLAGCYIRTGREEDAERLLLSFRQLSELAPFALEFLIRRPGIQARPLLAMQICKQVLSLKPFELEYGSSAKLAYEIWREYAFALRDNINESLDFVYHYLKHWNPMDESAISDLEELFKRKQFHEDDEWDRELWEERVKTFRANIIGPLHASS
ncbi:hypothetical protein ACFL5V_02790 [Fibrobacterota bacterium]